MPPKLQGRRTRGSRRMMPARRLGRILTRATHGVKIVPPADPPEFATTPWWPLSVSFTSNSDLQITPKEVLTAIKQQLNWNDMYDTRQDTGKPRVITSPMSLLIRMVSVRVWGLGRKPVQLAIYDHLGTKRQIAEMSDYGDPIKYSRLGWKFGRVGLTDSLDPTDTDVLFKVHGASSTNRVLVLLQVLFKVPDGKTPTVPSITEEFEVLMVGTP